MARPKGSRNKTRNTAKATRDHEIQIEILRAFASDPELKYYMGVAVGAGVGWIGKMLGDMTVPGAEDTPPSFGGVPEASLGEAAAWTWFLGPVNPALATWYIQSLQDAMNTDTSASGSLAGVPFAKIMAIGGGGFAGWCAAILILKSIFGDEGMKVGIPGLA